MLWHSNPAATAWRTTAAPAEVLAFHQALDGYQPTPLTAVPALAAELGVGQVLVKDESQRLGLPAFKAHVFIPAVVSERSIEAIRSEGAAVTIVDDSYDAAVVAAADAATGASLLIQDSAWPGYEVIPKYIVDGYSTLFREIDIEPDLVVVPMGVGSVAQAAVTHYRSGLVAPALLGVEPANGACVTASLRAGEPVTVSTGQTVMAGLNCGTASSLAWPVLRAGLDAAVTVEEAEALQAVEDMGVAGISSGASGAATLAGLRAARDQLELSTDSTVVLISTEAAW